MRERNHPDLPSILQQRFTNREDHIALFHRHIDAIEAPLPVLFFYGVGGIGKSWLLRRLLQELQGPVAVPSALIDFTLEQGSSPYESDPLLLLAELRRQFDTVPCPRFDAALTLALVRRYRFDESVLANKWKATGAGALWEIAKVWAGTVNPVLGGALSVLEKCYGAIKDRTFLRAVHRQFQEDFEGLRSLDLQGIEKQLTWRLSQDLHDETALPLRRGFRVVRAAVFVDTLEVLIPAGISESDHERKSAPFRDLIGELRDRILFVFAGQNRIDWSFIAPEWGDPNWLEQHLLGGLAEPDARVFLSRCGLDSKELQDAILEKCLRIENGKGFHAASLGLFADVGWIEINRNGSVPAPSLYAEVDRGDMASLVRRFLKSLPMESEQQWIRRLALTPSFDEEAARAMHSDGWSQAQDAALKMLIGLSFLVPDTSKSGWFAIHSAIQDALRLSGQVEPAWHQRWRAYWESRNEESLAWFHFWSLDRDAARLVWRERTTVARSQLDMARHKSMMEWWKPTGIEQRKPHDPADGAALVSLGVEYHEVSLGNRGANLRNAIACYQQAIAVYTQDDFCDEWARVQNNLGNAYRLLPDGDRGANLRLAITCFEGALSVYTKDDFQIEWATAKNNVGNAYQSLPDGDRATNLRNAISCYRQALEVFIDDKSSDKKAATLNNLGFAYADLPDGDRAANLRNAISCYEQALEVFARDAPSAECATTQHNLGTAYRSLPDGDLFVNLGKAMSCYEQALEVRTLGTFPADWAMTRFDSALVLEKLADLDPAEGQEMLLDAGRRIRDALDVLAASGHEHRAADAREALARIEEKLNPT